jgi:hypothetical protein
VADLAIIEEKAEDLGTGMENIKVLLNNRKQHQNNKLEIVQLEKPKPLYRPTLDTQPKSVDVLSRKQVALSKLIEANDYQDRIAEILKMKLPIIQRPPLVPV